MIQWGRHISSLARHYRSLLRTSARHLAFDVGRKLHATAITTGLLSLCLPNSFLRNTILHVYAACGDCRSARKVFDEIPNWLKDTVDWTTLMNCYARAGFPFETLKLFVDLRRLGTAIDDITLVSFFSACANLGDGRLGRQGYTCLFKMGFWESEKARNAAMDMFVKCGLLREARRVFDEMDERSIVSWTVLLEGVVKWEGVECWKPVFDQIPGRNEVAWTIIIVGYIENGFAEEAFRMLKEMVFDFAGPVGLNFVTLCSILSACTRIGDINTGRWVHVYALKTMENEMDVVVGTALIDMYAKCGRINAAYRVFKEMSRRNVATWNAVLSGLAMHGKGSGVLNLLDEMVEARVNPDEVTLTIVLSACSHSGLVDEGRVIFLNIERKYGIKPSMEHYACIVDLLGRAGHLQEAKAIVMGMPMRPNEFVLGSLLGACHLHNKIELAERVTQDLLQMYPGNIEYHVLLSNMYASAGKADMADSFRGFLKVRGIRKVPGRSYVHFGVDGWELG